ncbi:hypothetical protein ACQUFY_05965 [Robbsia andropogonis]|uniref:hypothetical protein n=1 Tax=Robbsia andropogonis TaxID=28092 RepID=UPI003D1DC62D
MSGLFSNIGKAIGNVFGINPSNNADAIRDAANTQAAAETAAAEQQAAATKAATDAQTASINAQAQATSQAQQAAINQNTLASQISAMQTTQPTTQVDLTSASTDANSSDPRRKYQGASGQAAAATSGGVGIRLT